MTEKLFYKDSHLQEFTANVISCEKSSRGYEAVLDRTAFFPEGGGQAADTGVIGDIEVIDVKERKGIIYHILQDKIEPGQEVTGTINWEKRFERMQQHSGEHIVSGIIHKKFGYNNVGFHLGEDVCTLDLSGPITKEELVEIEKLANRAVVSNEEVKVIYPSKEELAEMEYRSKIEIEGQVRIVIVGNYDICACCAPHVKRTGEIGLIKFVQCQNYKGGVRITMVCGHRALRDYQAKEASVKAIMSSLCSKEELIADAVDKMKEENGQLKLQLQNVQREILKYKVEKLEESSRICIFEQLSGNLPREMMNYVLENKADVCAVFTRTQGNGFRYVIGSQKEDVRPIAKKLNEVFHGRGGGKPDMVQGSLEGNMEEIKKMFEEI